MFLKKENVNFKKATLAKANDYENTFRSETGKRVLSDLINSHYIGGAVFDKDPHLMAFKEGQRNVILRILHILNQDITLIEQRLKEAQDVYRYD